MSDLFKFRGAVGGFNRADVVSYIESLCADHQRQLRKVQEEKDALEQERDALREEKAALQESLRAAVDKLATMQEQDASLAEQVELLSLQASELVEQAAQEKARADLLNEQLAALSSEVEPDEDAPAVEDALDYPALELEAYRRAEQAERNAAERADKIYRRLNSLCERAQERYADASGEVAALTSDLAVNLERLQQTLADLQLVSDDTQNEFDTLDLPALES